MKACISASVPFSNTTVLKWWRRDGVSIWTSASKLVLQSKIITRLHGQDGEDEAEAVQFCLISGLCSFPLYYLRFTTGSYLPPSPALIRTKTLTQTESLWKSSSVTEIQLEVWRMNYWWFVLMAANMENKIGGNTLTAMYKDMDSIRFLALKVS